MVTPRYRCLRDSTRDCLYNFRYIQKTASGNSTNGVSFRFSFSFGLESFRLDSLQVVVVVRLVALLLLTLYTTTTRNDYITATAIKEEK